MVCLVSQQKTQGRHKHQLTCESKIQTFGRHSQLEMDGGEFDNKRIIRPTKGANHLHKKIILEGKSPLKKPQFSFPESSSRAREFDLTSKDIGQFNKSKRVTESVRGQVESDLSNAKMMVRDLTSRIERLNSRAKVEIKDLEMIKKPRTDREEYVEVMRELEYVKQELSKLKVDMASVLEEKRRAEKDAEASTLKLQSYSSSVHALKNEIEELNEEQVLAELARIEALKEFGAIEDQRKHDANRYSLALEETRRKMKDFIKEIDQTKELETKLAITTSDISMLQSELMQVKEMDQRVQTKEIRNEDELDSPSPLLPVTKELEAAKKELASVREEGFQFMASMDIIRDELKHVSEETARLKKKEEETDLKVQSLNSKLLRAKVKLEAASAAEEKARLIISNLNLTLKQLKTEAEAAKKERVLICEQTANIMAEVKRTESEIDSAEERLEAAMEELEAAKASEAIALDDLKTLIENATKARASASQRNSMITISTFEYEYLTGQAARAKEIADKKVAAAQAWIEALKASEKEILIKTEIAHRNIRELRVEEEQEVYQTERTFPAKRMVKGESRNWRRQKHYRDLEDENLPPEVALTQKPIYRSRNATPTRAKSRKSASPAVNLSRSTSSKVRRRRKVMPNLAKLLNGKKKENDI